ncbi:uncharacterized protein BJ212DRAFT_1357997 [Suillus subaureus]|uniref:Uncharacterized protein n=1 Tax=Suillus subaureus TaxID=48587 RepID=A0A9P7EAM9_9AGAM|nr:uncharacterized protein BJ212DRAFT_1357997 [Suillus subaureus]KAG1815686.1 hypothetical protein BJ212DRAFT_1357997 [Suillus subaureus]
MNSSNYPHQSRRTHRKRSSVSKMSSDTVQTLPEYSAPLNWSKTSSLAFYTGNESDRPPDYPDSEEADADTEEQAVAYAPQRFQLNSPRRTAPYTRRRKRHSVPVPAADPFLDALLERSVHALEMSNVLMQSSISTQCSLSALLSSEVGPDRSLEVRARNLSTRIRLNSGVHGTWMAHLEEISKGVDGLFDEELRDISPVKPDESAISQSLPTSNIKDLRNRRRPSLLELNGSCSSASQLQFSFPKRDFLVAPAPRALTQYVESTADPGMIILPSTLGLRACASSHSADWQDHTVVRQPELQSSQSLPVLSGQPLDVPTPAYSLLSNIVKRSESATPPLTDTPSSRTFISRRGSTGTCSTERGSKLSMSPCSVPLSLDRNCNRKPESAPRPSSTTPRPPVAPLPRVMTPPIEELSTASSDSSDHPTGYRTVQCLRKILDEQSSSTSVNFPRKDRKQSRSPNLMPVTPAPAPVAGTSTATASISRLFTKGRHSSSTRPPSPPTHSSLKVPSVPSTPRSSPSTGSLSDKFGNGVAKALGSHPPSGVSTPKRISFAELPESYASSRPGSSKISERRKNRSRKRKGKDEEEGEPLRWFERLFVAGPTSTSSARMDDRMEERMSRGWGSRPGGGTLDDWAV